MTDVIDPTIPVEPVVPVETIQPEPFTPQSQVQEAEIISEPAPSIPVEDVKPVESIIPPEKLAEKPLGDIEVRPVRTDETGDKVYAIRGDKRYWIRNPETMSKMGFYLGSEKKIPFSELLQFSEGEPVDMTVPNAEYPWNMPEKVKIAEPDKPYKIWS